MTGFTGMVARSPLDFRLTGHRAGRCNVGWCRRKPPHRMRPQAVAPGGSLPYLGVLARFARGKAGDTRSAVSLDVDRLPATMKLQAGSGSAIPFHDLRDLAHLKVRS